MPPPYFRKNSGKNKQSTISRFFTTTGTSSRDPSSDDGSKSSIISPTSSCEKSASTKRSPTDHEGPKEKRFKTDFPATASSDTKDKLRSFASNFDVDDFTDFSHNSIRVLAETNTETSGLKSYIDKSVVNGNLLSELKKPNTVDLSNFSNVKSSSSAKNSKAPEVATTSSIKYTPLEKQVVEIKEKNPNVLLFVECGYKYRFFGEDAEIAAKELNIFCHLDHNFMTASIPTHRLHVHVRRLVAQGYKVGVVKQTETAALKAVGDNRNAPFTRHLASLYTKATLLGEDIDPSSSAGADSLAQSITSHLVCIFEPDPTETKRKMQTIALVAVEPATGDVLFDLFEDNVTRENLETRLTHIKPVEVIMPGTISTSTAKLVSQLVSQSASSDDRIRTERRSDVDFDLKNALLDIAEFYKNVHGNVSTTSSSNRTTLSAADVLNLPKPVICCLYALITYLKEFHLHKILQLTSNFRQFSTQNTHMQLNASCLRNLEIFQNLTNGKVHGSLIWIIDRTKTKFGSRLLRRWLARPLLDKNCIEERLDAVTEIVDSDGLVVKRLRDMLSNLPDLEKALTSVVHGKISPLEFFQLTDCLKNVHKEVTIINEAVNTDVQSSLLQSNLKELSLLLEGISAWASALDRNAARSGDKASMFVDESKHIGIVQCKKEIGKVLDELLDHRKEVRLALRIPNLDFSTVLGTEFLFELKHNQSNLVPKNWIKINSTKAVSRYHSPSVLDALKRLSQKREELVIEANNEWNRFVEVFERDYTSYKKAVYCLASLDCLFSLSDVAKQQGFCRPKINDVGTCVEITGGRHPVIDALIGENEQFVPNNCTLNTSGKRGMIITGLNMGGKSSYIKQVALIAILAQVGSYVPAESATVGLLDAIHTRMGASDELFKGRSTFMVELQEASTIMDTATEKSLVILDELGRGTSTHDGVAIAFATLKHFLTKVKCLILFVTHYPPLAEMENLYPNSITNNHMSFFVTEGDPGEGQEETITFLYEVKEGMASRSYGLNIAKLASIPDNIVKRAAAKSKQLEKLMEEKRSQKETFKNVFLGDKSNLLLLSQK